MSTNVPIQHVQNPLITITTNLDGDIFQNSLYTNNPFIHCKNIYEIDTLRPYKNILTNNFTIKKQAINIFEQNYSIFQLSQQFADIQLIQFILTDWYVNNPDINANINIKIKEEFCCIKKFSPIEQEVIYFILTGAYAFKDLCVCLYNSKLRYTERQIKATIECLYEKFQVNSKYVLVQALNQHKLNKYAPSTIIKPNIYC